MRTSWMFQSTRAIVCELGAASKLADHLPLPMRRPFLVTDPGIQTAGLIDGAVASLQSAGFDVAIYGGTKSDPAASLVLEAVEQASKHCADGVIGFGGGSSLDIAKLVAVLADPGCKQPLDQMYGVGNIRGSRLPLIQVPTTAGTGSEATSISILTTSPSTKQGIVAPQLFADVALLDGELTETLPSHVAAATGIDAMVHAIEAYTSRLRKNPLSDLLAREALRLLCGSIHAVASSNDVPAAGEARANMLLGSCYAGMAFANAPVAAVHALAYPLGATFHVAHGLSNSLMLPHVIKFNAECEQAAKWYAELAPVVGPSLASSTTRLSDFVEYLTRLPADLGLPVHLRAVGVSEEDVKILAAEAMLQTRLLPNNPREVKLEDAEWLYLAAL